MLPLDTQEPVVPLLELAVRLLTLERYQALQGHPEEKVPEEH